jgi:hypothetical protein
VNCEMGWIPTGASKAGKRPHEMRNSGEVLDAADGLRSGSPRYGRFGDLRRDLAYASVSDVRERDMRNESRDAGLRVLYGQTSRKAFGAVSNVFVSQ